jgi:hypothetical protein
MSCNKKCLCAEFVDAMVNVDNALDWVSETDLCNIDDKGLLELFNVLNKAMAVVGEELINRQEIKTEEPVSEPEANNDEDEELITVKVKLTQEDGSVLEHQIQCTREEFIEAMEEIQKDEEAAIQETISFKDDDVNCVDVDDEKEQEVLDKLNAAIDFAKESIDELAKTYDEETIMNVMESMLEDLKVEAEAEVASENEPTENDTIEAYAAEDYIMNDKLDRPVKYIYGRSYVVKTVENNVYYLHKPLFTHHKGGLCLKTVKAVSLAGNVGLNGPAYVPVSNIAEINLA